MGIIDLDCIATSPDGTSIYGIGNAQNNDGGTSTLIYKSARNPTDVSNMTWISMHADFYPLNLIHNPKSELRSPAFRPWYKYPRFGNVDCAVSSSGDFTAFFYNPEFAVMGSARPVPMGIQASEKSGVRPVWGLSMYGWTNTNHVHQSFYIEKDGVETAVHAVMDQAASVIRFGVVDPEKKLLKLAAVWKLVDGKFMVGNLKDHIPVKERPELNSNVDPTPSDKRQMVFANNTLYLYSDTTGIVSSFPFPSPYTILTQRDTIQASPAPTDKYAVSTFFRGTRQGTSYLGWLSRFSASTDTYSSTRTIAVKSTTFDLSQDSTPATITLSANNTITRNITGDDLPAFHEITMLHGMGGQLTGQQPFAVGLSVKGYMGFMTGDPSMANITSPQNATIIEGIESSNFRSPIRNYNNQVIPVDEIPNAPLPVLSNIAIAVGAVFLLVFLLHPLGRINNWIKVIRLHNEKEAHAAQRMSSHELNDLSRNGGRPPKHGDEGLGADSSSSGARTGSGATAAGGGEEASVQFLASSSGNSTVHNFLDGLGLSRHPRPSIITTTAESDHYDGDEETRRFQVVTHTQ